MTNKNPTPTPPERPELRVALQQAAHELDVAENALLCSSFHNAATRAKQAARTARAALSQPEPEVVGATDEELLELAAAEMRNATNWPDCDYDARNPFPYEAPGVAWLNFARAVLARWGRPAPAPAGERQAAPVPVASDVHFEFVVSDADYCTQAGGIAPTYAQALSEGQNYPAQYQQDGPHTLEVRRVEVLPLPSEEVEV